MATPSRTPTASARLRTKTSELSDLFRGRQHSSVPSPSDATSKAKRKIPLFSLRKKSPATPNPRRSPTPPSVPTPRPSTNAATSSPAGSAQSHAQPPQLTIPSSSFSSSFDDASSSKRSSISPTNSKSARSATRPPSSSYTRSSVSKSRTPTPTSAVTLGGGSFSDSEPPRSSSTRPSNALLRSYASDDEERRYLTTRIIPPSKPAPTKSLPPPPESISFSSAYPTPTTPTSPPLFFSSPASSYSPLSSDSKLPPSNVRKLAVSTSSAPRSLKFTSGSESASESAPGYTSASGSESATTGLGLGFRIRTRSSQGNGSDTGSTSRAASVRVGLLRAPNSFTASKVLSPPSPKSPPVLLSRSSPPAIRTSLERNGSRSVPQSQSSMKRASPPIQGRTSQSSSEGVGRRQTEPVPAASSTKHASWLVIPKAAHTPSANSPGHPSGQDPKFTAPTKLRARAASDSRTLTAANAVSAGGFNLKTSTSTGAFVQSITATALSATSPSNLLKSPSTAAVPTSAQANRMGSRANSPPPTEPLPKVPRPNLSRTSSETSQQTSVPSSSSPSSSESSTRTLTKPSVPSSTSIAIAASGNAAVGSSSLDSLNAAVSSPSGSTAALAINSVSSMLSGSGGVRRPNAKDERPVTKDKAKDTTWPARSASKRSSPTVSSPLVQSHTSDSPPYASPSSFSASTSALPTSSSLQSPPSRVIVPVPPTPANIFALQTENADLRAEIASLRAQVENADRLARRREREIRGLRWLVINWNGDKKETLGFTTTAEPRPSGDTTESQEEVQAAVRYLRAESESGYGSGSASASHSRMSHSSTYSSVYPAESVSDGSGSEVSMAPRIPFGLGPSARASEDQALDAIPERTVVGGEDAAAEEAAEAERRRKKDERRASRALKRLSASTMSESHGSGVDEAVPQTILTAHNRALSIEQVIEGDRARRERVGLKGMDEVLDKLRAVAGVDSSVGIGVAQ